MTISTLAIAPIVTHTITILMINQCMLSEGWFALPCQDFYEIMFLPHYIVMYSLLNTFN